TVAPSTPNNTAASVSGTVANVSAFEKAAESYTVAFDGNAFTVTAKDGTVLDSVAYEKATADNEKATLSFHGMTLDVTDYVTASTAGGEEFTLETRQMSFYSVGTPAPIANAGNAGGARLSLEYTDIGKLSTSDYQIQYRDSAYTV